MSSNTHAHPRRRPQKHSSSAMVPSLNTDINMSLRKSGTFHSPSSLSSDLCDPFLDVAFMPKRSCTNLHLLEEVPVESRESRLSRLLDSVNHTLAGLSSSSQPSDSAAFNCVKDQEAFPVPSLLFNHAPAEPELMNIDTRSPAAENLQDTDSGLGTSIGDTKTDDGQDLCSRTRNPSLVTISGPHSTITNPIIFSDSSVALSRRCLSEQATKEIQTHIIRPILQEKQLKEFHPLVRDVIRHIEAKSISNLRDLEKTLVFLAPEFSITPDSYLRFCETSIQCIHATVDFLGERDQRLPSDRPYTNAYFLDLVEQVRRYARIMEVTREKEAAGEELDDMDYSPDEKLTLRGGLSYDGQPMQLVREKGDQVIPIAESASGLTFKRPLNLESDDDSVRRSMARRRKSDIPGNVVHICSDCKREFKRPCDLSKHEKTHTRPWKCAERSCKYHELGWPTEKERDRHFNDKHSAAPPMHRCQFPPCTYSSKRESNCKQHMEKAHNYVYHRSKVTRRKATRMTTKPRKSQASALTILPTPNLTVSTPTTPSTDTGAPPTATTGLYAESAPHSLSVTFDYDTNTQKFVEQGSYGYSQVMNDLMFAGSHRRESVTTVNTGMTFSGGNSPAFPNGYEEIVTPDNSSFPFTAAMDYHSGAVDLNQPYAPVSQPRSVVGMGPPIIPNYECSPVAYAGNMIDAMDIQQPHTPSVTSVPHLSPGARADLTLFEATIKPDEIFGDGFNPAGDFSLFDGPGLSNNDVDMDLFNNPDVASHFSNPCFGMSEDNFDEFYAPS